jgi:hypothetical protein
MSEQPEDPTGGAMRAILKAKHGGLMSGGRIIDFERGWALVGLNHGKAHYTGVEDGYLVTLCSMAWRDTPAIRQFIFAPGNWTRCKRCAKLAPAEG